MLYATCEKKLMMMLKML